MIKELVQLVNDIPETIKERAVEPKTGLHILIRFDEGGNGMMIGSERFLGKKHGEISQFLKDCALLQEAAWMIDSNKCLSKSKDIHSASPYCFGIKRESWYGGDFFEINKQDKPKAEINDRIEDYFSQCTSPKFKLTETQIQKANQFKAFIKSDLNKVLQEMDLLHDLAQEDYIIVYNSTDLNEFQSFNISYTSEGLFNTSDYNIEVDGEMLGTSNFNNGFNSKKPFLEHHTASFDITLRINSTEAKYLEEFQRFAKRKLFPNPIPLFIDEPELTEKAIQLYHRSEGQKLTHREIISELVLKRNKDLGNYYLLYFTVGSKIEIKDFDYVTKFHYLLSDKTDKEGNTIPWIIENITEIKGKEKTLQSAIKLKTVFDFERVVIRELFNNALVKVDSKKETISMRYFDDMDPKYYRAALYTLLLKYRKPVYDFIYKSMRSGIGRVQFEDICMTGVIDDLRNPDGNKEYAIRAKLNIYFSLYQYFDKTNNQNIMPSKIEAHKAEITRVVDESEAHFTTDEAYAFGAGQLIYFLLSKSEAGERTHAVLEPFLQKTNHSHFNDAIASILLKYKHAISFDFKRFNTMAGEVLDYMPEKELQELRPTLLAGYFCPNILYTKKSDPQS